jgi:hypothetical protein
VLVSLGEEHPDLLAVVCAAVSRCLPATEPKGPPPSEISTLTDKFAALVKLAVDGGRVSLPVPCVSVF